MYETCTLTRVENRKKLISVQIICMCNLFTVETCMYNMFTADLHTEKRNIGNESSVLGKRLWVFSTKGEKLELPPTSKSLLSIASIFFSIPRFFRQHRCSFSFILSTFQLATSCGSEEILTSIYPIDFVLLLVPIFKI